MLELRRERMTRVVTNEIYAACAVLGVKFKLKLPFIISSQNGVIFAHYSMGVGIPILSRLLVPLTALIIASNGYNTPISDVKTRQLNWILIQATFHRSWFCRRATSIWLNRLKKDYGINHKDLLVHIYYL